MSQQKFNSNSTLPKGCGCLLLALVGVIGPIALLFAPPIFLSFGIKDRQVEISVGGSLFMKATKAWQLEGKQYVSSMNKGQQAYFAENIVLATSVDVLGLGIKTETNNYKYSIRATQTSSLNYAVAKEKNLKSYVGGVFLIPAGDAITTVTILCETDDRPLIRFRYKPADEPAEPIYQNGEVICGKGTTLVTK